MLKACARIVIIIKEKEASLLQSVDTQIDSITQEVNVRDAIFRSTTKIRNQRPWILKINYNVADM